MSKVDANSGGHRPPLQRTKIEQSHWAGIVKNGQLTDGNVIPVVSLVPEILRRIQSREALELAYEMGLIEITRIVSDLHPMHSRFLIQSMKDLLKSKDLTECFR